jgi:hypothetical protein
MVTHAKAVIDSGRDSVLKVFESETDELLESTLNSYERPPLEELREVLAKLDPDYSPVRLKEWLAVPGTQDLIIGYEISLAPWEGSARLRVVHRENERYHLIRPLPSDIAKAEEELAYWRGGDVHSHYGGSYKPSTVRLADCFGPDDLVRVPSKSDELLFRVSYGIGGTCPGGFALIWKYDRRSLTPESYHWDGPAKDGWRAFFSTPYLTLAQQIEACTPDMSK